MPCALAGGSVGGLLRFRAEVFKGGVEFDAPVGTVAVAVAVGGRGGLGEEGEVEGETARSGAAPVAAPGDAPPGPGPGPGACPCCAPLLGEDRLPGRAGCLGDEPAWI